jgi:hypothetical protein
MTPASNKLSTIRKRRPYGRRFYFARQSGGKLVQGSFVVKMQHYIEQAVLYEAAQMPAKGSETQKRSPRFGWFGREGDCT